MSSGYSAEDIERIAEAIRRMGSPGEAIALLCARVLVAPDEQEARRLHSTALRIDSESSLAALVLAWLESTHDDSGPIAQLRGLYSDHALAQIEPALKLPTRPLSFRNTVRFGERTFEVATDASGPDYGVITTTLSTREPARIVRVHCRVIAEEPVTEASRRVLMKGQHLEMVLMLRAGEFDAALTEGGSEKPVLLANPPRETAAKAVGKQMALSRPAVVPAPVPAAPVAARTLAYGAPPAPNNVVGGYLVPGAPPGANPPQLAPARGVPDDATAGARPPELDVVGLQRDATQLQYSSGQAVVASVFCAPSVRAGDSAFVQVFAHPPKQEDLVRRQASEFDDAAQRRGSKALGLEVPLGTELTVHLSFGRNVEVDEPIQNIRWLGSASSVGFDVRIPTQADYEHLIGTVGISASSIPLGNIKFKISVRHDDKTVFPTATGETAVRYRRAFISYCSEDRDAVLERVQMLRLARIEFFQDLISLEPGQQWERVLQTLINDADLFLLFWSNAARRSHWVAQEIAHALARKAGDDFAAPEIIPILLEGPPFPPPPDALSHLHFGDKLRYFAARS